MNRESVHHQDCAVLNGQSVENLDLDHYQSGGQCHDVSGRWLERRDPKREDRTVNPDTGVLKAGEKTYNCYLDGQGEWLTCRRHSERRKADKADHVPDTKKVMGNDGQILEPAAPVVHTVEAAKPRWPEDYELNPDGFCVVKAGVRARLAKEKTMPVPEVTVGPWMIRLEGDRVAVYFTGEYQFRCTPEEADQLKLALINWEAVQ